MPPTSATANRNLKLAACAVAFAAAMGGSSSAATASELDAIHKIERYCTVSWRNAGISQQEWDDCTQQALVAYQKKQKLPATGLPDPMTRAKLLR